MSNQNNNPSPVINEYPDAPLPTALTLAARRNVIVQFFKFVGTCLTIMMMVAKGHDEL